MKMPRYPKIYYVPGIISLLILPVLYVVYINKALKPKFYHVVPLIILNEAFEKDNPAVVEGGYPTNERIHEDINITGVPGKDKIEMAYSQIRVREILRQKNIVQGIHYNFGDSSNYGAFVKVLNLLQMEKAECYAVEDNRIWFFYFPSYIPKYKQRPKELTHDLACRVIYVRREPEETITDRILNIWDSSWLLIVSFSMLVFVSIRRLRRMFWIG